NTAAPRTDWYRDPLPEGALAWLGTVRFRHNRIYTVAWSPDGKTLASGSMSFSENPIRLWDATTGKVIRRLGGSATTLAWSPDGKAVASGWYNDDSTIDLWDVATGKEVRRLDGKDGHGVASLAWSPDGKMLASGGEGTKICLIRLWEVASG